jgi:ATP synthase F1 delta subunit
MAGEGAHLSGMAGRYATALFELALEHNALDAVKTDLDRFDALIAESADLACVVRGPVFSSEEHARALTAVLDVIDLRGLSAQFLLTVASNRRLFAVRDMIKAYRALVARHRGEVTAQVTGGRAHTRHLEEEHDAQQRHAEDHRRPRDLRSHRQWRTAHLRARRGAADGAKVFFVLTPAMKRASEVKVAGQWNAAEAVDRVVLDAGDRQRRGWHHFPARSAAGDRAAGR